MPPEYFLNILNNKLRDKIETQKNRERSFGKNMIDDARRFDKSAKKSMEDEDIGIAASTNLTTRLATILPTLQRERSKCHEYK